jgi:hypothetical protein
MTRKERQAEADRLMAALTSGDPVLITEGGDVHEEVPAKKALVGDDVYWWDDPFLIADMFDMSMDAAIGLFCRLRGYSRDHRRLPFTRGGLT